MAKYRKKPVEIEAFHFTEESKDRVWRWASGIQMNIYPSFDEFGNPCLTIPTLDGEVEVYLGDYIVHEVDGKLYSCKPDIFKLTYEEV